MCLLQVPVFMNTHCTCIHTAGNSYVDSYDKEVLTVWTKLEYRYRGYTWGHGSYNRYSPVPVKRHRGTSRRDDRIRGQLSHNPGARTEPRGRLRTQKRRPPDACEPDRRLPDPALHPCPMAISDMSPAARPLTLRRVYKKARSKQLHLTFRQDARD
jgi:hypothetical protein